MLRPFRLKRPIGPDSNMDLDDTLNTKRALNDLGFMALPDFGLTPFPDLLMIDGIKSFQRRHGLRVDGVMKPDGPTLETLNRTLAQRQSPSRSPNPLSKVPLPPRRSLLDTVQKASKPEPIRPLIFSAADRSPPSQPNTKPPSTKPKDGKQVASAAAAIPLIGELPAIISAIAGMLGLTLPLRGDTP